MATSIKTIKNHLTDDTIYPVTKANAVYLSDNVTTVEGTLGNLSTISSIGDGTIAGAISSLNMNLERCSLLSYGANNLTFNNGILIQWNNINNVTGADNRINFYKPFYNIPTVTISTGAGSTRVPIYILDISGNGFNIHRTDSSLTTGIWVRWIAIGIWKSM